MSRPKPSKRDLQIEIWSNALYRAMEYVQGMALKGDKAAKKASDDVIVILDEGQLEAEGGDKG